VQANTCLWWHELCALLAPTRLPSGAPATMMKQVLAIFALIVAPALSATCSAYTPTFGNSFTTAANAGDNTENILAGCTTPLEEGNAPTARCSVDCTDKASTPTAATANQAIAIFAPYNYNDYTYGNFIMSGVDTTRPAKDADYGKYGGGVGTCTTTTTFKGPDCQGASYFNFKIAVTPGASASTKLGLADANANKGTYRVGIDCAVLAAFDASWCRLASTTDVMIANGVVLDSSNVAAATGAFATECGADASNADLLITYIIRVNAQVMSAAAIATRAGVLDLDGAGSHNIGTYWSYVKAAITQMVTDSAATGAAALGTEQVTTTPGPITWTGDMVGRLYSTGPGGNNPWKDIASSTTKTSNPINSCDHANAKFVMNVRACDGSAARQIANGNQGSGRNYCTGSVSQIGCQHGCVDGYVPYGADATSAANKGQPMGVISYITTGATTIDTPTALAVGTGGGSKCATDGTFTAGTCVKSYKGSIDITVGTNIATNKADYDTDNNKKKQRQVECAFMNVLKASCCTPANGATNVADATLTTCRGVAVSSTMSATGGIITFQFNVANSVSSQANVQSTLGTAATVKTNLATAINSVQSTANHYTLTGIVAGDITTVAAITPQMCYLDQDVMNNGVVLQTNSSLGCTFALAPGQTCTPVCGSGYNTATGTVSCSSAGVLTGYNCTLTPTPTPTPSSNTTAGSTGTAATLTGNYVQMSQRVTYSALTATDYTAGSDLKKLYQCVYLKCISTTYCTVSTGSVVWLSTIGIDSTAAASTRRAASVTFTTQFSTSLYATTAALQTATSTLVADIGNNFVTLFSSARTASGWTNISLPGTATAQAVYGYTTSSAGVVIPSALAGLAASIAALFMM